MKKIYFGKKALTLLREKGVLKVYEDKCRLPWKLIEGIERLWINNTNGSYHWEEIGNRIPLCGSTLFYQYTNDDKIYCCSCENFGTNGKLEAVDAWYQTAQRNFDISQKSSFTYAEIYAMEE